MEKVSILTKHATELGFRINEVELKSGRLEKEEEEEESAKRKSPKLTKSKLD